MTHKPRDWTPRLIGDTYCSPACGMGCTKAAYDDAHNKAIALHHKMTGKAWIIRVWENLGWHYEIYREGPGIHCSINERFNLDGSATYTVYFNSRKQIVLTGDDPNTILTEAVQEAKRMANDILCHVALFPEIKT